MKKIIYIVSVAMVLLPSCSRSTDQMVEWTFKAPATKAAFSDSGEFSWDAGDKISVWDATSESFVSFTTAAGKGIFRATAPADAHFSQWAYFPGSMAAGLESINIEEGTIPMCARIEDGSNLLHFKHAGALVTIRIINIPEEASSFVLSSESTAFSGSFSLTEGVWTAGGSGSVTFPLTEDSFLLRLAVPVGEYSLEYCVKNSSGSDILRRKTEGDFNFLRAYSYVFPLENMDIQNSYVIDASIPVESVLITPDSENWIGLE